MAKGKSKRGGDNMQDEYECPRCGEKTNMTIPGHIRSGECPEVDW